MTDLTACVTSFKRASHLNRCLASLRAGGIKNATIATSAPDNDVDAVIENQSHDWNSYRVARIEPDIGCHRTWELATYQASTHHVIIVHDDDNILPQFGEVYQKHISPALDNGAGFASWRARLRFEDGSTRDTEYIRRPTGICDSRELESFVLKPKRLSLSPIVSVFNRTTLIHALKEGEKALTDYLHPSMLLGSEILAYLRHCSEHPRWLFVDEQLSEYGAHSGSGTVQYQNSNNLARLTRGYDAARLYYTAHKNSTISYTPRILLLSAPFQSSDASEQARFNNARMTWNFHFNQGTMLDFPIKEGMLPRSSKDLGDSTWVPFLKDVIDYGCERAMDEDIVCYSNLDCGMTTKLPDQLIPHVQAHGVAVVWRRTLPFNASYPLKTCVNGERDGGVDFIGVSKAWWKEHRSKIPDMFIASNFWDYVFRVYAERASGGKNYLYDGCPHFPHDSFFSRHRMQSVRQQHNHAVAKAFFKSIGAHKTAEGLEKGRI